MLTQLKNLQDVLRDTFQKAGIETYSQYVSGNELTYFTKGLANRGWPELMTRNTNHVLANCTIDAVLREWEKKGEPILGDHAYLTGKSSKVNYRTVEVTHNGVKYLEITHLPQNHFKK